eukprot:5068153-Pyramimonas_sp.AAC.1
MFRFLGQELELHQVEQSLSGIQSSMIYSLRTRAKLDGALRLVAGLVVRRELRPASRSGVPRGPSGELGPE